MGQHLQAEQGKREGVVFHFDHVLGGGDDSPGSAIKGFLVDLPQKTGGIRLVISESDKAAQGNALVDQALPEGFWPGNPAKTIKRCR